MKKYLILIPLLLLLIVGFVPQDIWEGKLSITRLGYVSFETPHGVWADTITETVADVDVAYTVHFNRQEDTLGIYDVGDTAIYVREAGDYGIIVSACADATGGTPHMWLWYQLNGVNVPRSNTVVQMGNANETVIAVDVVLEMNAGDYIKIKYRADNTSGRLLYTAGVGTNNNSYPSSPSVILTIKRLSR